MARPAAHWAQEPDKGNADVGRELHGEPKERQRDHKAITARHNTATKQIKRRKAQQTPPKSLNRGAGTRLRDQTERVASAPTGGEGATGAGGGAAAKPHAGGHDSIGNVEGMWTRDEASVAAREANPASVASRSGERSEPIRQ